MQIFFEDLAGALSRVSGVASEHAFLLFNLFSKVTILTFAFSDVHWSLPKLKLWSTGQRQLHAKATMLQGKNASDSFFFFFSSFFFFLNN